MGSTAHTIRKEPIEKSSTLCRFHLPEQQPTMTSSPSSMPSLRVSARRIFSIHPWHFLRRPTHPAAVMVRRHVARYGLLVRNVKLVLEDPPLIYWPRLPPGGAEYFWCCQLGCTSFASCCSSMLQCSCLAGCTSFPCWPWRSSHSTSIFGTGKYRKGQSIRFVRECGHIVKFIGK